MAKKPRTGRTPRHVSTVKDKGLRIALKAAGSKSALADVAGVSKQALTLWKKIPAERARAISAKYGIPLSDLRGDLWPLA